MNSDYFTWFPYILIFESVNKKEIKMRVSYHEINHTQRFNNLVKCGHCEDSVKLVFVNERDTLDITMNNLDNPNSFFGYELYLYNNSKKN